jgi:purine nucleoside phosphorylase
VTQPFNYKLNAALLRTLRTEQKLSGSVKMEFVLWLSTGPQYETEAEVNAIERMGGEVVGMTAAREAKLCAELGMPYTSLVIASNWAAGRHPGDPNQSLSHAEVSETSRKTTKLIVSCLINLLQNNPLSDGAVSPTPR